MKICLKNQFCNRNADHLIFCIALLDTYASHCLHQSKSIPQLVQLEACLINLHVLISIKIMNIHLPCPMTGSGNVTMSDRVTLQYIDQNKSIHVHGLSCTCIYNSTNSQILTITICELGCQHLYIAQSTGTGCQTIVRRSICTSNLA